MQIFYWSVNFARHPRIAFDAWWWWWWWYHPRIASDAGNSPGFVHILVFCYWSISMTSSHEHSHTISMISRPPAHFINLGCWSLSFVFVDFWVLRWYASGRRHPEWCFLKFSPPFGRRLCSGLWLPPTVSGTSSSRWRRRRPESSWRLRRSVSCSRDHSQPIRGQYHSQPIRDQYPSHVIAPSRSEATVSVS